MATTPHGARGAVGPKGPQLTHISLTHCISHGDNAAMVLICHSGRNPSMRHMGRTHGISLTLLHGEVAVTKGTKMGFIGTEQMAADIFTKFFSDRKIVDGK